MDHLPWFKTHVFLKFDLGPTFDDLSVLVTSSHVMSLLASSGHFPVQISLIGCSPTLVTFDLLSCLNSDDHRWSVADWIPEANISALLF